MATTTAEVVALEQKRDTRGRRITPLARRLELVAGYRASGLTQLEFARREGINPLSLAKWCSRSGARALHPKPQFVETRIKAGAGDVTWSFEVSLPSGCVVRAARAVELAELLSLIRA